MTVKDSCEEFSLYLSTVRGMTENTVKAYGEDYKKFCEFVGEDAQIDKVTLQDLRFCVGSLSAQKYSVASINRFIASVRALFAYSQKFGRLKINPALQIKSLKAPKHLPNFMTGTEVDALCSAPEKKELLWAARDKAIFEMLYSSGCRVAELSSLKLGDFAGGGKSAVVKGKGKKDRIVYFEADALKALSEYLPERKALLERPEDPRTTQLRKELNELRRTRDFEKADAAERENRLSEELRRMKADEARAAAGMKDVTQLRQEVQSLREQLQLREKELLSERQTNEELRRQQAASQQMLMARLAELESPSIGTPQTLETNQSREAKQVKLPSWMRLHK